MRIEEFLLARFAEDERDIRASRLHEGTEWWMPDWLTDERLLAECEAKRRIVEMASRQADMCPPDDWPETGDMSAAAVADSGRWFLRAFAAVYAEHPDYDESWRP